MQKLILYLTIAVVGVGFMVLVSEYAEAPASGSVYKDASEYNTALSAAIDAGDVPEMPSCAKTVEITKQDERIEKIEFICGDSVMRDTYEAFIHDEYAWDIAISGDDRVRLTRILEE